ncbi:ribose ABC transporter, periplasmic ribose-binding protein [Streptomyces sp. L-9-10]|uniref:ABC transporter substrate-binding protein n=1 Tax=Streptomyces sp. L-9-10 TaxID=1478131 RepID=UPI00101C8EE7|nr:ABC transporter substrate-binding protein [Streptomyces sp. L-9-10]RYJ27530.1 ribose ABC transporter, periplasmic ribose-binding protein [Streptomyces sp. L-9-10]
MTAIRPPRRSPLRGRALTSAAALLAVGLLASCTSDTPPDSPGAPGSASATADASGSGKQSEFFEQAEYDRQLALAREQPQGPAGKPWEQMLSPELIDTTRYKKKEEAGGVHLCFSNAGVFNPWRQVGLKNMTAEVELHKEIREFTVLDAQGKDDKQISDIQELTGKGCDALIVSPNTTATLTPAVEQACAKVPVIVFDRGVETDCAVTFINPVGGYGYGAVAADFLVGKVKPGGKILALRISPGVDVLETRWSAAKVAFDKSELDVVDVKFTDGDPAKTKSVVTDALTRHGSVDGVWMDSGATAVAAVEAFEDAGQDVPPITGEDQQDFLQAWKEKKLTAFAPTYPTFQWRTPVIAALRILQGQQVPREWKLPQPSVTQDTLDEYLKPGMPPLHYAMCGCADLPGYPEDWGGKG